MDYLISKEVLITNDNNMSLIQRMIKDDIIKGTDCGKVVSIFKYLYANTTREGKVKFNLRMIIKGCGYVAKRGDNGVTGQFKEILNYLNELGYFGDNDYNFHDIRINNNVYISAHKLPTPEHSCENVVKLTSEEEDAIRKISGVRNDMLEAFFLVVKASQLTNMDKPQLSSVDAGHMAMNIGVSLRAAQDYAKVLQKAGLIALSEFDPDNITGSIYKITNRVNGKEYVGMTTQVVKNRWSRHKQMAQGLSKDKRPIHHAITEYGVENFTIEVIEENITNFGVLQAKEIHYIDIYNTFEKGYNMTRGGD